MEKYQLTESDINELIRVSKRIKHGEMVKGTIGEEAKKRSYGTIIVSVFHREPNETLIPRLSKAPLKKEIKSHFRLLKCSICQAWNLILKRLEALNEREDDFDKIYHDELGRKYYLEGDKKIYQDDRNFEYWLEYSPNFNREIAYTWFSFENGESLIGTFLDEKRTLIEINGTVYRMNENGEVLPEEKIDYIGPRK